MSAVDPSSIAYVIGTTVPAWFAYRASRRAGQAKDTATSVKESVGEHNGSTLIELAQTNKAILAQLVKDSEYTHIRNHDIINAQARMEMALNNVSKQLENIIGR